MRQAERTLKLLYGQSYRKFGYDFFVRKHVERRLWSVIGAHLKALEQAAAEQKFSHST